MLEQLDDDVTLRRRVRRTMIGAAAVASAILAPLVDEILLGGVPGVGHLTVSSVLGIGGWAAALGALLGGLTMHHSLNAKPNGVLWLAALAGAVYPALFLAGAFAPEFFHTPASGWLESIVLIALLALLGIVISAPTGFCFGLVFRTGSVSALGELERPSHESPARALGAAAKIFAAGAVLALCMSPFLEGAYCQLLYLVLQPALGAPEVPENTDLAWTVHLALPAPLLLMSAAALVASWMQRRALRRTITALRAGTHPHWALSGPPGAHELGAALPLRAGDREGQPLSVRARAEQAPYRDSPALVALLAPDA